MIRLHLPSALAATRDLILSAPDICRAAVDWLAGHYELTDPEADLDDAVDTIMARDITEREFLSWLLMPCPAGHELGKWGPS